MGALEEIAAATVAGETLTLAEVLRRARDTGQLGFLTSAIQDRLIARAIAREGIAVSLEELEKARRLFRADHALLDEEIFARWLSARSMTREALDAQLMRILAFGKLKEGIASDRVEPYFEQHREEFAVLDQKTRSEIHARLFQAWLDEEWKKANVELSLLELL